MENGTVSLRNRPYRSKTPNRTVRPERNSLITRSMADGLDKIVAFDLNLDVHQGKDEGEAETLPGDKELLSGSSQVDSSDEECDDEKNDAETYVKGSDDDDDDESEVSLEPSPLRQVRVNVADGFLHVPYPRVVLAQRPGATQEGPGEGLVLRYKISGTVWQYNAVVNAFRAAGLTPTTKTAWANIYWGRHLPGFAYSTLIQPWQKLNHFPGTWCIGRKDRLAITLKKARVQHGSSEFGFLPQTFVLPAERAGLERASAIASTAIWIQKPYSSSCGKGIKLVRKLARIGRRSKCVVSRYIRTPFLIDGFKFDLRLYCVVTCMDPLRIYMNDDGLARFATEKFKLTRTTLSHRRMHLTNYSVNKSSSDFVRNEVETEDAVGSKWSFKALLRWFAGHTIDSRPILDQIHDLIIKTVIVAEASVQKRCSKLKVGRTNCFELFGFDILLDSKLRPWLLEVNILPSLSSSSPLDKLIKTRLMSDVFHIIGVPIVDGRASSTQPATISEPVRTAHVNMQSLSAHDVMILRETEAEYRRRGNLNRIYPTSARSYARFFETARHSNLLLERWMALPRHQRLRLIGMERDET